MAAEGLLAGATPFGWAQLGLGLLSGGAKPAGPSSADALFGPSMMNNDSSGWLINFGDGASSSLDNGNRGAPSQTPVYTQAPGGYSAPVAAPGNTAAATVGALANLPWLYIAGGAALLIVLWKKG